MGIYAKATTLQIMQQTISYEKGLTIYQLKRCLKEFYNTKKPKLVIIDMGIYAKATTLQIMQQTISYEKGLTISTTL